MSLRVRSYYPEDAVEWDALCNEALQSTFLHTRRFLAYHDDRFVDRSLIIESDGKCVGLFPSALKKDDETCIVSHPGITYGGVLHKGDLRGERMVEVMTAICFYYRNQGYKSLLYKAVPTIYHKSPTQDDLYALFRLGAVRARSDLSCTIDLQNRLSPSKRRLRSLKKAQKASLGVFEGRKYLTEFWSVLEENLRMRHDVTPVHKLCEISHLVERFPCQIRCICAILDDQIVAGVLLFKTQTLNHAQYIASTSKGNEVCALDAVFEYCFMQAKEEGKRWFDFGISNEQDGAWLNDGLYRFKSEFGGGGVVHDFFEISLNKIN